MLSRSLSCGLWQLAVAPYHTHGPPQSSCETLQSYSLRAVLLVRLSERPRCRYERTAAVGGFCVPCLRMKICDNMLVDA